MTTFDPLPDVVIGYPKLAAKIEILPEAAIYRRYGALNAQDLLYQQAELTYLEQELRAQQRLDHDDQKGHGRSYATNWIWLKNSKAEGNGRQLDLVLEIREKLAKYNEAVIKQAKILKYPEPTAWDLQHLQDYLGSKEMGTRAMVGEDSLIWGLKSQDISHKPDLVALRPRAKKDAFSMWATESTIFNIFKCGCYKFMKPSPVHGAIGYEDSTVYRVTYWFTSILASLIPIASIVILYRVQSMAARLGIIAAFNVLLSVCLMGFAGAKRSEVFAITAAFAAVQVVFVSADKSTATCTPYGSNSV
ncbi:uncharacterized protein EKO05_0005922 [Ascochyta rabiei]|uniref:uncharacterized protein n=1 Tax=Didymella rabiei TaxID=5454 RepID=UPI0021FFC7C7|nr:uncharacterized protein EKO05_0005922 [Ascochyta rabiei]UPX15476.1 hypothetical protein EKO05_0005922 [Ascochyta rabiei]